MSWNEHITGKKTISTAGKKNTYQPIPPNPQVQDRLGPQTSNRQSRSLSKILPLILGCYKKLLVGHMGWVRSNRLENLVVFTDPSTLSNSLYSA